MQKGPYLNKIEKNFTTRDSLGIDGVVASISADICPVVTTVTPRAFYWPFMVWIYYDFYKYSGIEKRTISAFDQYLKRQDYFFVLATLLNEDSDRKGIAGVTQVQKDITESDGPYPFNQNYLKARYGGMQYYNGGCHTLEFITDHDDDGHVFSFPKLTRLGEKMALSFEDVIKDTSYYKNYRKNDKPVPKEVLKEYGKTINLSLKGFDKCKSILKHRIFDVDARMAICADYIKYLYDQYDITYLDYEICRKAFYDHIAPSEAVIAIPDSLKAVADGWEIVVGRQYFTCGLKMLWKPMLEIIRSPKTMEEWITSMMSISDFTWDINEKLDTIIPECIYDFDTRERMISDARRGDNVRTNVEDGIAIILSTYNWLKQRTDFGGEKMLLDYGVDSQSISLSDLVRTVEEYKDRPIREFITYVMQEWIIRQHYFTAFEKMLQNRDGFYYELVDGKYYHRGYVFEIVFQGIRMIQLMQIMRDMDML